MDLYIIFNISFFLILLYIYMRFFLLFFNLIAFQGFFCSSELKNSVTIDFSLIKKQGIVFPNIIIVGFFSAVVLPLSLYGLSTFFNGKIGKSEGPFDDSKKKLDDLIKNLNDNFLLNKNNGSFLEPRKKLEDIAGFKKVKQEVENVLCFFNKEIRKIFDKFKLSFSNGIVFYGPPGNGKTVFAEAIAGELGFNFYKVSAAPLVNRFIGTGANNIKSIFDQAKKICTETKKGCVLFIDEVDSIPERDGIVANSSAGNEYSNVTNQMLQEMDNLSKFDGEIVVIIATNFLEKLDPAMIREGRFNSKINIGYPSDEDFWEIELFYFKKHLLCNLSFSEDEIKKIIKEFSFQQLKEKNIKLSCAEIESLVNKSIADCFCFCYKNERKPYLNNEKLYKELFVKNINEYLVANSKALLAGKKDFFKKKQEFHENFIGQIGQFLEKKAEN